ncbi:MAG: NAD-dependent epimerase/dehydratase family protein [Desulfobacterales bacterium]|nr:NAD-dependent epimerase/dehydratase family protein [Desulfobacterales bacterium]
MHILITGGAGFIGSHTADALIEKGHTVRILDNLQKTIHPEGRPEHLHPKAEFIFGDVRVKDQLYRALQGIDAVFHFAAYQDYLPDFSTFFHVNTVSTALLYEILVETSLHRGIQRVVVASSQAVMGEGKYTCPACDGLPNHYIYPEIRLEEQLSRGRWEHRCPVCRSILKWLPSDESVIHPCNQYAISKYSQEQIAMQLGKRYRIPTAVLRYSIVQGPRQSFHNAYSGAMRIFALSLLMNRPPIIFEDGRQVRDFVNIRDVVRANLMALEQDRAAYQVFNVGGGVAWSVLDFFHTMQQVVGRDIDPILSGYYRYGDTRHIFSDTGKIQGLGWKATHDVRTSIQDYWEYIRARPGGKDVLERTEAQMKKLEVIRRVKDPR